MKKTVFWGILILIGLFFAYDVIRRDFEMLTEKHQKTQCGKVVHKSEELRQAKHATNHNMYVTIYCNDGTYHDVDVSTHTYLNAEKGDVICFKNHQINWWIVYDCLCLLCLFATIITSIVFFIWGCSILYDKYIDN